LARCFYQRSAVRRSVWAECSTFPSTKNQCSIRLDAKKLGEQPHLRLAVPLMNKVGKLRQSSPPEAGKTYRALFSNKGSYVKRGDKVNVMIGDFRADGLVVD
jgi:hypothetical protein